MRPALAAAFAFVAALAAQAAAAQAPTTETIVLLRHAEKPPRGLGQLDCQGLNRALALPAVLARLFARPAALFAPNPAVEKPDHGGTYAYIRPLATIEPTAIALGQTVNIMLPYTDAAGLQRALTAPEYHGATVIAVWEHNTLMTVAKSLVQAFGGDAARVPAWPEDDYDSLFVVRVTWKGQQGKADFEKLQEDLNGRPAACPGAPK